MDLLNGQDVMAILPTGFGKSGVIQSFTLVKMQEEEFCSVIIASPLTSIASDQIKDFEDLGIPTVKLDCNDDCLSLITRGEYRVVIGSPEAAGPR